MRTIDEFCGQKNGYSLSKTLRFELKPQGKTLENINKAGLVKVDEQRAKDYQDVKKLLDNYHKYFIDDILKNASEKDLDWKPLKDAVEEYQKDKTKDEQLKKEQDKMRSSIVKCFSADKKRFDHLTAATPYDLFKTELPEWLSKNSFPNLNNKAVETFKKFSTYFTGYQETRKNIYSAVAISTAVPFRIVHDNFPKFLQNLSIYKWINEKCPEVIKNAQNEIGSILAGKKLEDFFTLNSFNIFLTQTGANEQRGIDFYNQLIGGVKQQNIQIKGINQCINEYWQQHPEFAKENRRVKMVPLYKQILSDRSTLSFVIESIENDKELFDAVTKFNESITLIKDTETEKTSVLENISTLIKNISDFDTNHVFVNAKDLAGISLVLFGKWDALQIRMNEFAKATFSTKQERSRWVKKLEENSTTKRKGVFSFAELDRVLAFSSEEINATGIRIKDYFDTQYKKFFDAEKNEIVVTKEVTVLSVDDLLISIQAKWNSLQKLINNSKNENQLKENEENVAILKDYLDCVNDLFTRLKVLNVDKSEARDTSFYSVYDEVMETLSEIMPLYNKARNYITKKTFDIGKYKLNFDNPTLASGWDLNKEDANTCVILEKDGSYYLGVMNAKNKPKFSAIQPDDSVPCYKKMVYKLLPGPNKMLPKVFFSTKGIATFNPSKEILEGYNAGKHKKGDTFDLNFCHKLIDYFKSAINQHPDWKNFNFKFSDTSTYKDTSDFYKEISEQGYKLSFVNVPVSIIDSWVDEGKLYLFQIYNKDFSPNSTGTPNMHTLYWRNLFSKENLDDVVLKLNGEAELFYRGVGIKNPVVHAVGSKVVNRTTKDGKTIPEAIHDEIYKYVNRKIPELSQDAKKLYENGLVVVKTIQKNHELIKDKHYTQEKFLFHVPITINYKASGNSYINENVRQFLKNNPDVNIIGLDRGERHLIYMSLIDQKGNIIQQKTFNTVERKKNGATVSVDYHEKLDQKEKERDAARKNWQTIGKIAELKEGYLSAVIHELVTLMIEHNAIIVMEDLNFGFKRGRFHVEKQVYQKFEHMLIDKLNYLVFKDRGLKESGGVLNGYQLAGVFESFQKLGKQSGFLFYVPAGYTSKIDPATGFANLLDMTNLTNVQKKRDFFAKFDSICFDEEKQMFAFTFDYKNFNRKDAQEMSRTKWTVYSNGKRIQFCGKGKASKHIENLTEEFKTLFREFDYQNGNNILDSILEVGAALKAGEKPAKEIADFWDKLLVLFKLVLQIRNSDAKTGDDYIISPVMSEDGIFFDSREQEKLGNNAKLPKDADANGAYHIALKGLYLLKAFDKTPEDQLKKVDMKISNADWFRFAQEKEYNK